MERRYNTLDETVKGMHPPIADASFLHFLQWAFGDLCDDDIKGIFAEWLIMKLLDIPSARRCSWANNDLCTAEGVTIEVKASAYWQSWKMIDGSGQKRDKPLRTATEKRAIVFRGMKARDAANLEPGSKMNFKSQMYVFAFQKEENYELWNAMDLSQWDFYIRKASDLNSSRIRLVDLERLTPPLSAENFREKALRTIKELKEEAHEQEN